MPLYEYQCAGCGKLLEVIQKFSDDLLTECPECGEGLEKLLSAPAIQFKGSGWYITDYARKGANGDKAGSAASDSAGGDKAKSADSAKSGDSAPATESKSPESSAAKAKSGETSS